MEQISPNKLVGMKRLPVGVIEKDAFFIKIVAILFA
jgi:hypothetical protein